MVKEEEEVEEEGREDEEHSMFKMDRPTDQPKDRQTLPSLLKVFEADAPSGVLPCRFTRHFDEQLAKIIKCLIFS